MPVQLDVKRAVLFCVGHLVRRGKLIRGHVSGQTVCKKLFVAGHKLYVRNVEVVVRADAVILQRIQAAAKLALDHDGMQPCRAELAIEFSELRRAHGLIQHLPDDLLLGYSKQRGVLLGAGRLADGLEEDWQQLLLVGQRKDDRPIHLFGGQISTGDSRFGDMKKLCFCGGQGHVRMPNPFSGFFDGVGDEQRGGADERAQRVADHVIHLRHTESIAVLGILDSCAENAADERREGNSTPTVPLQRQHIGQRQPQREEKKHVHQHFPVELRLLTGSGKCGEWGENEPIIAGCAGQDGDVEDGYNGYTKQYKICHHPPTSPNFRAQVSPSDNGYNDC